MGIRHPFESEVPDGTNDDLVKPSDWNAEHDVDFLEMPEGSAPSTPASGLGRIYFKTDGRAYSKDDAGNEYGPFDSGGAMDEDGTTSDFYGLSSIESGADILNDKFNYATITDFKNVWTPIGTNLTDDKLLVLRNCGVMFSTPTAAGYGIKTTVGTGSMDIIIAVQACAVISYADMWGPYLLTAGVGEGFSHFYDGNGYMWNVGVGTPYVYTSTGTNFGAQTSRRDGRRYLYGLKRNGTTHTYYIRNYSTGTWTTLGTRNSVTARTDLFIGRVWNGGGGNTYFISQVLIGTLGNLL